MKKTIANGKFDSTIVFAKRFLPKNRWGDYMSSLFTFVQYQGRFPNRKAGGDLNDFLFSIKTSKEILNPLRVFVSDKQHLKLFVKATIGDSYNVPTDAVLSSYEEALSYSYPKDCVIKPTHMSGEVIFRRAGSSVDFTKVASWFNSNYYNWTREANYKSLKPKIIVEPFIFGADNCDDYKIFCIRGQPRLIVVDTERQTSHRRNLYTTDWTFLPVKLACPPGKDLPKPQNLEEMLRLAGELSRDFSFMRVDLYSNGNDILVGELTNCPGDARDTFEPKENAPIITKLLFDHN